MRWLVNLVAVLALFFALAPASAQTENVDQALDRAVEYIKTQQQADGSFAGISEGSTADAVYALVAAGEDVASIETEGNSAFDFINTQGGQARSNTGLAAKYALALLLAGQPATLDDGTDLIAAIEDSYNADTGQYGADVTAHANAMIALVAAGREVPPAAVEALKDLQNDDGGWSFDGTSGSDTNTTALAVQALVAAGDQGDAVSRAVEYYRTQQNDDGGFPYSQESEFGTDSDANSTALAIQALIAAGEDLEDWAPGDNTPLDRLLQFQNDSGAFRYQDAQADDNPFATYQAVPAFAGETLPLSEVESVDQAALEATTEATTEATEQPEATQEAETTATPEATTEPTPEASPDASPTTQATASPEASASPDASPAAGETTDTLPNTGMTDWAPVYALIAGTLLLLSGLLLRQRKV